MSMFAIHGQVFDQDACEDMLKVSPANMWLHPESGNFIKGKNEDDH